MKLKFIVPLALMLFSYTTLFAQKKIDQKATTTHKTIVSKAGVSKIILSIWIITQ